MKFFVDQPFLFDALNEKDRRIQFFLKSKGRIILKDDDALTRFMMSLEKEIERLNKKFNEFCDLSMSRILTEDEDTHICVYSITPSGKEPVVSLDIRWTNGEFTFNVDEEGGIK